MDRKTLVLEFNVNLLADVLYWIMRYEGFCKQLIRLTLFIILYRSQVSLNRFVRRPTYM
jgi:hypothetical protein